MHITFQNQHGIKDICHITFSACSYFNYTIYFGKHGIFSFRNIHFLLSTSTHKKWFLPTSFYIYNSYPESSRHAIEATKNYRWKMSVKNCVRTNEEWQIIFKLPQCFTYHCYILLFISIFILSCGTFQNVNNSYTHFLVLTDVNFA